MDDLHHVDDQRQLRRDRRLREFGVIGRLGCGIVVLDACAVIRQRGARQEAEVERVVQGWEKRLVRKTGAAIKAEARSKDKSRASFMRGS